MVKEYITIKGANTLKEVKKITMDKRLQGIKLQIKDVFKEQPKDLIKYWKKRIKGGQETRFTISVPISYYN